MFLTTAEDSHHRERKHKEREREANEKRKKSSLSSLSLFLLFCFSLSLSCFFFGSCFFWLSFLSLEVFLSQACLVSLSPAILMNLREVFRERHFAAQKRALQREKREREREREKETRERARKRTLFTDGSFSPLLFLSAITARNEPPHGRRNIPFSRKTENSHVFPGKPSS